MPQMLATIEMFDNADLARDTAKLREMIYARGEPLSKIPGLQSKIWFNNAQLGRFGAFLTWSTPEALAAFRAHEDIDSIAARWGVRPSITDFEVYQTLVDGFVTQVEE
jgi:hypothetical protein